MSHVEEELTKGKGNVSRYLSLSRNNGQQQKQTTISETKLLVYTQYMSLSM